MSALAFAVLDLELREDASSQGIPQLLESFGQIIVHGEHEVDRVTRIDIEVRRESVLGVCVEDFCYGGNRVGPAVVRQVDDQPIDVLVFQGLSVNVDQVQGLPLAGASYASACSPMQLPFPLRGL
jgi:hypothetical protein